MKVGDRVKCIRSHDYNAQAVGKFGTIRGTCGSLWAVEFDVFVDGHDIDDRCEHGNGWNIPANKLKLIEHIVETARDKVMF